MTTITEQPTTDLEYTQRSHMDAVTDLVAEGWTLHSVTSCGVNGIVYVMQRGQTAAEARLQAALDAIATQRELDAVQNAGAVTP